MSPPITELKSPASSLETALTDEEIREIISLWRERLFSLPPLVQEVLKSALEKMEKALGYTEEEIKKNAINNASRFLTALGLYLSSPSFQNSPPETMEKLIAGLNSFCPEPQFLTLGDTFIGNDGKLKIIEITPPTIPPKTQEVYIPGTNMWDQEKGNQFVPGNYKLEKIN